MIRSACHFFWLAGLSVCIVCGPARSDVFLYAGRNNVYGRVEAHRAGPRESLIEIARVFDVGYNAIVEANPGLDPFAPGEGSRVVLPLQWVLPEIDDPSGIVINLSDFRLYHFHGSGRDRFVETFPVAIGDEGWKTPLGRFSVVAKVRRPSWTPPVSIRTVDPELPASVPSGIENPLGSHALRLSLRSVLIHGTNRPFGIGRRVSHGCIHLYPEDIPLLYTRVRKGTRVTVVRQPVKVGFKGGRVFVQVHRDREFKKSCLAEATRLLEKKGLRDAASIEKVRAAVKAGNGIPADVTGDVRVARDGS